MARGPFEAAQGHCALVGDYAGMRPERRTARYPLSLSPEYSIESIKMSIVVDLDCEAAAIEELRCACGDWSRLTFDEVEVSAIGIRIVGRAPTLVCDRCGLRRLPQAARVLLCDLAAEARRRGTPEVKIDVAKAAAARERFDYCDGVDLLYSALDTKYIPGLSHAGGHLTPVFFSKDALTYFYHHPDYTVTFESDAYGTLRSADGGYISFGLTRHGRLLMWLGDLNELSRQALMVLAAHNFESDHDIGSEFYEGQIEAKFTDLSQEKHILRAQNELAAELFDNYGGLKLLQMDNEALDLMSALRRPIHFSESEFGDLMEAMTKLFIERINVAALKEDVRTLVSGKEAEALKKMGGLKTLETWLRFKLMANNASQLMLPLFVLYDLRVAFKHLIPAEKRVETKESCFTRLGLGAGSSLPELYGQLAPQLQSAFESMKAAAVARRNNRELAPE